MSFLAADVSGDGYPDVVMVFPDGTVQVSAGGLTPVLAPPVTLATGVPMISGYNADYNRLLPLVCEDMDGDGRRDLAFLSGSVGAPALIVLRNRGAAGFSPLASLALPGPILLLTAADFDRDGDIDLLTEQSAGSGLLLFRNAGGSAFDSPIAVPGPGSLFSMVAADFTGDGVPDLAAILKPNDSTFPLVVWRNDGHAGFELLSATPFPFISGGLAAGDFDGNGTTDLALGGFSAMRILRGAGDGTFGDPEPWAFADYVPYWAVRITAVDINGDGKIDLAYGSGYYEPLDIVLPNVGGGFPVMTAYAGDSYYQAVGVADFDRDGRQDFVGFGSNRLSLLRGLGGGRFSSRQVVPISGGNPQWITVADFDGDRRLDLADVDWGYPSVQIHLQKSPGAFQGMPSLSLPDTWGEIVEAGDFDSDGLIDLIGVNRDIDPYISLFHNEGGGNLVRTTRYRTRAYGVAVADLDGDGRNDLVATTSGKPDAIEVRRGLSGGTLADPEYSGGVGPNHFAIDMATGDFNGDHREDIAECSQVYDGEGSWYGTIAVYLNDGHAHFLPPYVRTVGTTPLSIVAADLDGDGKVDLAVADGSSPTVWLLWNDGPGTFSSTSTLAVSSPGRSAAAVAAADFDGDRLLDLAVTTNVPRPNYVKDGSVALLYGMGSRTFANPIECGFESGSGVYRLRAADLDNDGDPDLALSTWDDFDAYGSSNVLYVLWNESPGLPTATLASLVSADVSPGEAHLVWWVGGSSGETATVERTQGADWLPLAQVPVDAAGYARYLDLDASPGRHGYRLRLDGAPVPGTEGWVDVPVASALAIGAIQPNPGSGDAMMIAFTLAERTRATLALFDATGRLVREQPLNFEPGAHVARLTNGARLPAGIYFVRLTQGRATATRRIAVLE